VKTCVRCGEVKPLAEFGVYHRQGQRRYRNRCKPCLAAERREWTAARREHINAQAKAYRQKPGAREKNLARTRYSSLKRKYGVTPDQYLAMLEAQNGVCAACGHPEKAIRKGTPVMLSVDHDHVTGQVRGLLCTNCNATLGHMGDSTDRLKQLIYYLGRGGGPVGPQP